MSKLFVYGTLKQGQSAHNLLSRWHPTFLGAFKSHERFVLYDQGAFPGIVEETSGGGVHGELYEVSDDCMKAMDHYEAVDHGLFRHGEIELTDGTHAIAYMIVKSSARARKVESGIWGSDGEESEEDW